jgi:predicted DNA-binding antitoxin AbrB/MazE fold protein
MLGYWGVHLRSFMMEMTVDATYEDGVLKVAQPLPLEEHEKVRVTIADRPEWRASRVQATYGMMGGKLDAETIERIALDPELGIWESP